MIKLKDLLFESNNFDFKSLNGKKIKKKNSDVTWEVWATPIDDIPIMNYSSGRPMSRRISFDNFIKYWEIATYKK